MVPTWQLRARFAARLAEMYGAEVPAYHTLVEVCREVNEQTLAAQGMAGQRLGSIERVSAERHGAIRLGSPREMSQVARVFAAFGMYPVGFYDLRDASTSAVPVVSTAFRPVEADELARNPFRVFTSMLVADDRRFFDVDMQARLEEFISARELFGVDLLRLADRAADQQGLADPDAARLLDLATEAFRLATGGVRADTQVHTHMCYAEFGEILGAIEALDADVISLEAARSRMGIARDLADAGYPREVGPGVYDIHSPRVPSVTEMAELLRQALRSLRPERLWVNPDCGLKTRAPEEADAALQNMTAAAREVRSAL
jgi:hypothetical protein